MLSCRTIRGTPSFFSGLFTHRNGKTVLTGAGDKTARLWEAGTGKQLLMLPADYEFYVEGLANSPDGKTLLTGGDTTRSPGSGICGRGRKSGCFVGHDDHITDVAYSPDGKRVLTGSGDGTARLWI